MRAEHGIRIEVLDVTDKARPRVTGKDLLNSIQAARELGIIRLFEHHPPQFRRVLDQGDVSIGYNFAMQRRKEFREIELFDSVIRSERAPCFVQRRSGSEMARP